MKSMDKLTTGGGSGSCLPDTLATRLQTAYCRTGIFSLTSDGKLTAKNADISGSVNANSGTLNNVTINQNCTIKGMLEATQVTHCPAQQHLQVHTRILSVLVLIRTPLRLVHMDTPSPLTLLVTRKTPSKTSHLTIL
mgnify:CR=1 FL=1